MGIAKHLLLGTAACLTMIGAVEAADLPVKARPIEYVRICSQYGAGFFAIVTISSTVRACC